MNKILTFLSISALFVLIACNGQSENKSEQQDKHAKESTVEKTYYYTCPMVQHKHIASTTPGDCSECGMKLVAAVEATPDSADYYGCSMPEHSNVRYKEPGKCEECNMELVPMRLKTEEKI